VAVAVVVWGSMSSESPGDSAGGSMSKNTCRAPATARWHACLSRRAYTLPVVGRDKGAGVLRAMLPLFARRSFGAVC